MDLANQLASKDKIRRKKGSKIKDYQPESSLTQTEKCEELVGTLSKLPKKF